MAHILLMGRGPGLLRLRGCAAAAALLVAAAAAHAQTEPAAQPSTEGATPAQTEPATPPSAEPGASAPAKPRPDIEGAIGPMISVQPEYQGGAHTATKVVGGIFIRWGRYTITNAGGFVTRRDDDVMRGFAADLVRSERLRVNLALRIDRGRDAKDSAALSGLQDVRSTLRGRLIVTRGFDGGYSATLGTSVDLLGRGGGTLVDIGLGRGFVLPWSAPWRRTTLSLSTAVTAADRRYMQSYFGISEQQAASTGYAAYAPSAGLRDAALGVNLRSEFGNRWVGYVGAGASRLLGPARESPLTQQRSSWAFNGGLAWRF